MLAAVRKATPGYIPGPAGLQQFGRGSKKSFAVLIVGN